MVYYGIIIFSHRTAYDFIFSHQTGTNFMTSVLPSEESIGIKYVIGLFRRLFFTKKGFLDSHWLGDIRLRFEVAIRGASSVQHNLTHSPRDMPAK